MTIIGKNRGKYASPSSSNIRVCETTVGAPYRCIAKNIFIINFFLFRTNFLVACGGPASAHVAGKLGQLGFGLSASAGSALLRNANASVTVQCCRCSPFRTAPRTVIRVSFSFFRIRIFSIYIYIA